MNYKAQVSFTTMDKLTQTTYCIRKQKSQRWLRPVPGIAHWQTFHQHTESQKRSTSASNKPWASDCRHRTQSQPNLKTDSSRTTKGKLERPLLQFPNTLNNCVATPQSTQKYLSSVHTRREPHRLRGGRSRLRERAGEQLH